MVGVIFENNTVLDVVFGSPAYFSRNIEAGDRIIGNERYSMRNNRCFKNCMNECKVCNATLVAPTNGHSVIPLPSPSLPCAATP
jgi:hypothetical protein